MQDFVPPTTLTDPVNVSRPVAGPGKGFSESAECFESLEVGGVVKQHTTAGTDTLKLVVCPLKMKIVLGCLIPIPEISSLKVYPP